MPDSSNHAHAAASGYYAQSLWNSFSRLEDCKYSNLSTEFVWGIFATDIPRLSLKMSELSDILGDQLDAYVNQPPGQDSVMGPTYTHQQMADALTAITGTVITYSHVRDDGTIESLVFPDGASFVVQVMNLVPTVMAESLSLSKGVMRMADDCCRTLEALRLTFNLNDSLRDSFDEMFSDDADDDDESYADMIADITPVRSIASLLRSNEIDVVDVSETWAEQIIENKDVRLLTMLIQNVVANVQCADAVISNMKGVLDLAQLLERRQGELIAEMDLRKIQEQNEKARMASLKVITNTRMTSDNASVDDASETRTPPAKNPFKLV